MQTKKRQALNGIWTCEPNTNESSEKMEQIWKVGSVQEGELESWYYDNSNDNYNTLYHALAIQQVTL